MKKVICVMALLLATLVVGKTASAKIVSSSKSTLTIENGRKASTIISSKKDCMVYFRNLDSQILSVKWVNMKDGRLKLVVKGKKVGRTKLIITNTYNKEKMVIPVRVKKKHVLKESARKILKIPRNATYNVEKNKFYWSGGCCNLIHVEVRGTGKYKGYKAWGDFGTDYTSGKSMYCWTRD